MTTTVRKEVCSCEKCGNEAEMTITCELVDVPVAPECGQEEEKGNPRVLSLRQ